MNRDGTVYENLALPSSDPDSGALWMVVHDKGMVRSPC